MVKASDNWNTTTQCLLLQQLKQWILFLRSSPFHHGEHFSLKRENTISITNNSYIQFQLAKWVLSVLAALWNTSAFKQQIQLYTVAVVGHVWDLSPLLCLCWNRKNSKKLLTKAFFLITLTSLESTKHLPLYNKMILTIKDASYWLRTEGIPRFFPVK